MKNFKNDLEIPIPIPLKLGPHNTSHRPQAPATHEGHNHLLISSSGAIREEMLESLQSLDLQGFLTKRSAFRDGIHNVVSQLDSSYASQKRSDTNRNANQKSKEILYAPSCQCFERFRRLEARRKGNVLLAIVTSLIFIGGQKKVVYREPTEMAARNFCQQHHHHHHPPHYSKRGRLVMTTTSSFGA